MSEGIRLIPPEERTEGADTPGMTREQAVATDRMWAGMVRTEPGMFSGWHHHGDYETTVYVLEGGVRMESGPGGSEMREAHAGDFLHVPAGMIHREGNPTDQDARAIVIRAGSGAPVFNVEGPESST